MTALKNSRPRLGDFGKEIIAPANNALFGGSVMRPVLVQTPFLKND